MHKLDLNLAELEVTTFLTTAEAGLQMDEGGAYWTNPMDNCISASDLHSCFCGSAL
jgi:hypothetical protein